MYRSLNLTTLGTISRQSELLELALTHKFSGIDVDVETVARRQTLETLPRARQMFESARIRLDGFKLPITWQGDEAAFSASEESQKHPMAIASGLGLSYAATSIAPNTTKPFPDEFEQHVKRISQIAESLVDSEMKLGLTFNAAPSARDAEANEFVCDVEKLLALLDSIKSPNVGVVVDTLHWVLGGGTVEQLKALPLEKIIAVRFASLAEDVTPDEAKPTDRTLPHSEGLVNNGEFVAALAEIDYEGPVLVWPENEVGKQTSDRVVRAAKGSLDQLWIDAGLVEAPPTPESESDESSDEESSEQVDAKQA